MTAPTPEQWRELLVDVPGSLGAVLQEVFASHDADQAARRANLRKPPPPRTAQDVHALVYPQYSVEPFAKAVQPLLKPSMRAIAARADMAPGYLTQLIRGERSLDVYKLQRIATAARVSPAYFLEYRQMMVVEAISARIAQSPEAGIAAYRAVMRASDGELRTRTSVRTPQTDRSRRGNS